MEMIDLAGKRVLITGASRGVGQQIALALAPQGCTLLLHARTKEACEKTAAVARARGAKVETFGAELADGSQVDNLIAQIETRHGGLDVLYNNAAIMTPWREAHTTPADDYRTSFEVNVIALVKLCDAFLPGMRARGWGRVINVTSGIENIPELLPYSMSKAAVDRYVRDLIPSLAGTGVVMSLMDPGWLRTGLGGEQAPNDVQTCIPGALVPIMLESSAPSGALYAAQDFREDAGDAS